MSIIVAAMGSGTDSLLPAKVILVFLLDSALRIRCFAEGSALKSARIERSLFKLSISLVHTSHWATCSSRLARSPSDSSLSISWLTKLACGQSDSCQILQMLAKVPAGPKQLNLDLIDACPHYVGNLFIAETAIFAQRKAITLCFR